MLAAMPAMASRLASRLLDPQAVAVHRSPSAVIVVLALIVPLIVVCAISAAAVAGRAMLTSGVRNTPGPPHDPEQSTQALARAVVVEDQLHALLISGEVDRAEYRREMARLAHDASLAVPGPRRGKGLRSSP
jgi:hypothetical protein